MREILFRGKCGSNWHYGDLYTQCNTPQIIAYNKKYDKMDTAFVDPETVGQYTGLRDCKRTAEYPEGQMIFEGDIVDIEYDRYNFDGSSTEHRAIRGTIGYDSIGMIGITVDEHEGSPVWADFFNVLGLTDNIADWSIEVIGNIHDNKEILDAE